MPDIARTSYRRTITTIDSRGFKVFDQYGTRITRAASQASNEVSLFKHDGKWFTFDGDRTLRQYDLDFGYLSSFDKQYAGGSIYSIGPYLVLNGRGNFQPTILIDGVLYFGNDTAGSNYSPDGVQTSDGANVYEYDSGRIYKYTLEIEVEDNPFAGRLVHYTFNQLLGQFDIASGTVNGLYILRNQLFVLYDTRLIKVYNKDSGAFIGDINSLPTLREYTDLFVEDFVETLGIKDSVTVVVNRVARQKLGIKPTAEESRDLTVKATANQKLAIKPEAEHLRIRTFKRIVTQKLAIKPDADRDAITTHRGVEQKVGIKPTGEHLRIRTRKRIVNEKLGIKPDATESHSTNIRRSVTQKVGIKPESGGLLFSRARSITQKLGIKPRASKSTHEEVTQKLGIKPTATSRSIRIVIISVIQKLGIKPDADHLRIRTIKRRVTQRLAIKPDGKAARNFKDEVTQKLGIKPEAIEGKDISRTITQKVGIKDGYSTRFKRFRAIQQKLGIKPTARGKVSKSPIIVQTKVGIKPDAKKDRKVKRTAPQKLRIAGSVSMLTRYARVVTQRLQFGVHAAPLGLPSKAPFFNVKNRIRRVFRV